MIGFDFDFFSSKDVEDNSLQLFYKNLCSKINKFNHNLLRRVTLNVKGLHPFVVLSVPYKMSALERKMLCLCIGMSTYTVISKANDCKKMDY
jgi:hypothetical protein